MHNVENLTCVHLKNSNRIDQQKSTSTNTRRHSVNVYHAPIILARSILSHVHLNGVVLDP